MGRFVRVVVAVKARPWSTA